MSSYVQFGEKKNDFIYKIVCNDDVNTRAYDTVFCLGTSLSSNFSRRSLIIAVDMQFLFSKLLFFSLTYTRVLRSGNDRDLDDSCVPKSLYRPKTWLEHELTLYVCDLWSTDQSSSGKRFATAAEKKILISIELI